MVNQIVIFPSKGNIIENYTLPPKGRQPEIRKTLVKVFYFQKQGRPSSNDPSKGPLLKYEHYLLKKVGQKMIRCIQPGWQVILLLWEKKTNN